MKTKKIAIMLSIVLGCTTLFPSMTQASTYNGWSKSNNSWYYYSNGNMKTGWVLDNGRWYYLNSNGAMATGWKYVNGSWYYLNNSGDMATGWKKVNGTWYYLNNSGDMAKGWKYVNGIWYYLNNSGAMATGWKYVNGSWYYLENSGAMAKGWKEVKGEKYYLSNSGAMVKGWQTIDNNKYYFKESGAMAHDTAVDHYFLQSNGIASPIHAEDPNDTVDNTNAESQFKNAVSKFTKKTAPIVISKENNDENIIYSPESLYMALGMLSQGSEGNTKSQLLNNLYFSDNDKLAKACKDAKKNLEFASGDNKCTIGNSLWLDTDNDITFKDDNIDKISKAFSADIFKEDLQDEETAVKKSEWVMEHTNNLLGNNPKDFEAANVERMNIMNTLYFKDEWENTFLIDNTVKNKFNLPDGKGTVDADFMCQSAEDLAYEKENEYKVAAKDFKNGNSMVFILPEEGKSPYDIINNNLDEAINSLNIKHDDSYDLLVKYKVPKFQFKSKLDLNASLKTMGLTDMYSSTANFSNFISKGKISVSQVDQNTFVSIDENGAKAAAYTNIHGGLMCPAPKEQKVIDMNLNRPFAFAILNKDKTPLFIGVVNNPSLEG